MTSESEDRYAGCYFKVTASELKRIPSFSRFTSEASDDSGRFWLVESIKKVTCKNPDWFQCFGSPHSVKVLTRAAYIELFQQCKDQDKIVSSEGSNTAHVNGSRSIAFYNREAETSLAAANRKKRLRAQMDQLAASDNWLKAKYDMLSEDPEILHKWNVIKEGAHLCRMMSQKEKNSEWSRSQKLRRWQAQLLVELDGNKNNDRAVFWIMDQRGGSGKTWFTKYMYKIDPEGTAWLQNGKTSDLIKIISDQATSLKLVMFDLCRSNEERINWDAIERIKNGMLMSTKYEVESTIIDSPAVLCFANFEPDLPKLSVDRWMVYEIKNQTLYRRPLEGDPTAPTLGPIHNCAKNYKEYMQELAIELGKIPGIRE